MGDWIGSVAFRYLLRGLSVLTATFALSYVVLAHPANVPVARAKIQPNGQFEMSVTFDILAFVLDQTPELVLDAPMNALLDGTQADLQSRLEQAKNRFLKGIGVGRDAKGLVDSITFPTAQDIHDWVAGQTPRLPVLMTAKLTGHFALGTRISTFHFPEVMGPVVLTTEFPYNEPISESIEPGELSQQINIPSQFEIDRESRTIRDRIKGIPTPEPSQSAFNAHAAIQHQYNAWSKAYMAHDLPVLFGILTPDYSIRTAQGKLISHDEYLVMLKLRKQKHSDTTVYRTEIVRLTLKDGVAAVWSREFTTDPGLNQKTGKPAPVSYQHDYIDLWVLSKGKWLLRSTSTQKEQIVNAPSK